MIEVGENNELLSFLDDIFPNNLLQDDKFAGAGKDTLIVAKMCSVKKMRMNRALLTLAGFQESEWEMTYLAELHEDVPRTFPSLLQLCFTP